MSRNLVISSIILLVIAGYFFIRPHVSPPADTSPTPTTITSNFAEPIDHALSRITKKPFGIKVSPGNSPVQPEKFSGYHTGTDFETTPDEADKDIVVRAICDGPLIQKRTATGYGGVIVQSCQLNGSSITVIYGHVKLTSVSALINQQLTQGQQIAILGKGYSSETDGERKHLHLGIHKGTTINIQGYTQSESELTQWLSIVDYLR